MKIESNWFVYIVETCCGKLYTGITTDVERRFNEHRDVFSIGASKGAKFFRGKEPKQIVYRETCESRSDASKREYSIKKMTALKKRQLFCNDLNVH